MKNIKKLWIFAFIVFVAADVDVLNSPDYDFGSIEEPTGTDPLVS